MDRIRLIGCPLELKLQFRSIIQSVWGRIQKEKTYHGSHEFKLEGYPWTAYDVGEDCIQARMLIIEILSCAIKNGWTLLQGTDISRLDGDSDVLFFENAPPEPEVELIGMSLHSTDLIRLQNAPIILEDMLRDAVLSQWPKGLHHEKEYYGSYEIKMYGTPWRESDFGRGSVARTLLMCQIIANFRAAGYKLYAALDISQAMGGSDLDTWVFRKVATEEAD
jgi:hypothetical protein